MEDKKVRAKRQPKSKDVTQELLAQLSNKLNMLEAQVKERDEKLKNLDNAGKTGPGFQKFGQSQWEKYEKGKEKGMYRSNYVDIQALMGSQYYR